MEGFRQNNEITYDDKELMEENSFVGAEMEKEELPVYENVKKDLPQPIWENHS